MSRLFRPVLRGITSDLRQQFACPTKSIIGSICTRRWEKQNQPLIKHVISKTGITPNSKILEIGHGRGYGLEVCSEVLSEGEGCVFGLEISPYMASKAMTRLFDEVMQHNLVVLDRLPILNDLPYPTDIMDAIYHVDVFYFWAFNDARSLCREFFRVLKPGARLVCGMELNRLRRLEKYGVLEAQQYDPMQYMVHLEPAGFCNVKIEYEMITPDREAQIITAQKPEANAEYYDPEAKMQHLENEIKMQLARERLLNSQHRDSETIKQAVKRETRPDSDQSPHDEPLDQVTKSRTAANK